MLDLNLPHGLSSFFVFLPQNARKMAFNTALLYCSALAICDRIAVLHVFFGFFDDVKSTVS